MSCISTGRTSLLCHNTAYNNIIRATKEEGHFRDLRDADTPKPSTCNGRADLPGALQIGESVNLLHYQGPTGINQQSEQRVLQNLERGHTP